MRDLTDQHTHTQRFVNELSERDLARENTHRFLKTLGHEMRNPLAVLTNVTRILNRLVEDDRGKRALQQVPDQLAVLRKMADDLMDVARLELGKVQLQLAPVDLKSLLEEASAAMHGAAAAKSIRIECLLPPGGVTVLGDRERLIQVVGNLLSNAVKYTHMKGCVWVTLSEEGREAVVRVEDTGIGIFPPVLPKIFDLFTHAPEGEQMRTGGIGVGLALVRQLVELHGGTVQAKSLGLGKGSEFSFRLPVDRPNPG
jgi:two-component system CheB/CheR fusion protein